VIKCDDYVVANVTATKSSVLVLSMINEQLFEIRTFRWYNHRAIATQHRSSMRKFQAVICIYLDNVMDIVQILATILF